MKTWHVLAVAAFAGAAAVYCAGCDDDEAATDSGAYESSGEVSDDGTGMDAAADAGEEEDTSAIPEEQFNQLKELWDLQILAVEEQARTLAKINEEHKDESLAGMIDSINAKTAEMRKKFNESTAADRKFWTVDLPKQVGEGGELVAKAMERMQEVVRAKAGIGTP